MVQHCFEICSSVFKGFLKSVLEISKLFFYPLNPNPSPIQTQDRMIMYAYSKIKTLDKIENKNLQFVLFFY